MDAIFIAILGMVGGLYVGLGLWYVFDKVMEWIWSLFTKK